MSFSIRVPILTQVTYTCEGNRIRVEKVESPVVTGGDILAKLLKESLKMNWYGSTPFEIVQWNETQVTVFSESSGETVFDYTFQEDGSCLLKMCK